jgi:hypothetical protein
MAAISGGITLNDAEGNKKVIIAIVKELGKKLMEGSISDLLRISRPAMISSPKTFLQAIATDSANTHLVECAA